MLKRFAGRLRLGWTLVIAFASLLVVIVAGLLVLNWMVIPNVLSRVQAEIERRCECPVSYESASYLPLRGMVISEIAAGGTDDGGRVAALFERIRFPLSRSLLSALRGRDKVAMLVSELANAEMTSLEQSYAALNRLEPFLPRTIELTGVQLRGLPLPGLVTVRQLSFRTGTPSAGIQVEGAGTIAFDPDVGERSSTGGGRSAFSFYFDLNGATQQSSATLELSRLPLANLGRTSFQSGVVDLQLRAQSVDPLALRFEGVVDARDVTALLPSVVLEPLTEQSLRFDFAAAVNLADAVPDEKRTPRLLLLGRYGKGSIRFSRGDLTLNGLGFSVRPALYGLFAAPYAASHPAGRSFVAPITAEQRHALLDTPRMLEVALEFPTTSVDDVQRAIPNPVLGPLNSARFDGEIGWKLDLVVPLHELTWMNWESTVDLRGFAVRSIPETTNVFKLNDSFVHQIGDRGSPSSRVIEIPAARSPEIEYLAELAERSVEQMEWLEARRRELGQSSPPTVTTDAGSRTASGAAGRDVGSSEGARSPGTSPLSGIFYGSRRSLRYVRLGQMSEWVPKAVMTAEDGDFFYHHGVSFLTLRSAIERNIRAGSIEFGASTISMQLIKMLFLDQKRIFARKFQEVFLVYLMEHLVPVQKARILELYLNIAEFGPGVFGVDQAARYYFDTRPSRLTIGQATWLASVLPSPQRYHYYFAQGAISDGWFARMKSYYAVMLERERITEQQYADLILAPPEFPRSALRRAGFDAP